MFAPSIKDSVEKFKNLPDTNVLVRALFLVLYCIIAEFVFSFPLAAW